MSKPYWNGPGSGAGSRFADDVASSHSGYGDHYDPPTEDLGVHEDLRGYEDYDDYDDYRPDNRWRWVAGLAAVVLLIALVAIAVSTRGGDTATSSTTPTSTAPAEQDAISTTPRTVIATVPPSASAPPPPPAAALAPETIVTVTQSPSAEAAPPPAPAPVEAAPPAQATPPAQTITYTVTGTRQLFDLVSIIYTDEQGFPRTDVNVALPWSRTVVLNPGVSTKSVTATSLTGQLNCTVTDGSGATLAAQNNNAAIATCTP